MEIVEGLAAWSVDFQSTWLAHFQQTGQTDFKQYTRPRNREAPGTPGVDLSASRLLFITSSGAYLPQSQPPFDDENNLGDYSIRVLPSTTSFENISYAHTHYDRTAVGIDPQVLMPLDHLREWVAGGRIGALTPSLVSFCGYHPDVERVVNETIPPILELARKEEAHAALLVPA